MNSKLGFFSLAGFQGNNGIQRNRFFMSVSEISKPVVQCTHAIHPFNKLNNQPRMVFKPFPPLKRKRDKKERKKEREKEREKERKESEIKRRIEKKRKTREKESI